MSTTTPLAEDKDGNPVYLKDIWPSNEEISEYMSRVISADMFRERYSDVFKGDKHGRTSRLPAVRPTNGRRARPTYNIRRSLTKAKQLRVSLRISSTHVRWRSWVTSVTTDHISPPATSRRKARPATSCCNTRCARTSSTHTAHDAATMK